MVNSDVINSDSIPLVSIIIPCYNNESFICQAIESALGQTWRNKEVIVVDDGSKDDSYQKAKVYQDKGVRLYLQENSGACSARNKGFYYSKGDYIQYLDADDLLSPDKIEKQIHLLKGFPPGFLASGVFRKFTDDPSRSTYEHQFIYQDFSPVEWLVAAWTRGEWMQTACWLTPRSLIEKAGPWDENLKMNPNDDGEFFCRVLLNCQGIKFSGQANIFYRIHHGERVSEARNATAVASRLGTFMSYEKNILHKEKSQRTIKAVARNYTAFVYEYFDAFPELAAEAERRIKDLGIKKIDPVGGVIFLTLSKLFGFKTSLKIRSRLRKFS